MRHGVAVEEVSRGGVVGAVEDEVEIRANDGRGRRRVMEERRGEGEGMRMDGDVRVEPAMYEVSFQIYRKLCTGTSYLSRPSLALCALFMPTR